KMIRQEQDARVIGYGGMLMESFVAGMALAAATALDPGIYFPLNAPLASLGGSAESAVVAIRNWGFAVSPDTLTGLAAAGGENSLLGRTGGATPRGVGMA